MSLLLTFICSIKLRTQCQYKDRLPSVWIPIIDISRPYIRLISIMEIPVYRRTAPLYLTHHRSLFASIWEKQHPTARYLYIVRSICFWFATLPEAVVTCNYEYHKPSITRKRYISLSVLAVGNKIFCKGLITGPLIIPWRNKDLVKDK